MAKLLKKDKARKNLLATESMHKQRDMCNLCPLADVTVCPLKLALYIWWGWEAVDECKMRDAIKKLTGGDLEGDVALKKLLMQKLPVGVVWDIINNPDLSIKQKNRMLDGTGIKIIGIKDNGVAVVDITSGTNFVRGVLGAKPYYRLTKSRHWLKGKRFELYPSILEVQEEED